MSKKIFSILIFVCLTSCSSYGYDSYSKESHDESGSVIYKKTDHSFFWGTEKEESSQGMTNECESNGKKVSNIESSGSIINYITRIYTLGIYWPRTIEVECV